jgi:hypothetical protein
VAFNATAYEWSDQLKTALGALESKRVDIDRLWEMYEGEHPRVWLTKTLASMFEDVMIENLYDNWIELAVEAPLTRTRVLGWATKADSGKADSISMKAATNIWDDNSMDLQQVDLYRHVRIAGEGFVIAWEDPDKDSGYSLHVNDPREIYYPETPHGEDPEYVVKVWLDLGESRWRATVYYAVDVVRLVGPERKNIDQCEPFPGADAFVLDPADPGGEHGFEEVPVIRYAKYVKRRSHIKAIIPGQHRINKLTANKVVAGEFSAWRKLAILTQQKIDDDDLRMRPNRALILDPGSTEDGSAATSIWEGSATELSNFDNSIDKEVFKLFTKAYLPSHMMVNPGSIPSGDAIEADEGPYVEMILDSHEWLGSSHKDLFELLGIDTEPQWRNPAVRSEKSEATTVKTYIDAGVPLPVALKKYAGWTEEELTELDKLVKEEEVKAQEKQAMAIEQMKAANPSTGDDPNAQPKPGQPKPGFPAPKPPGGAPTKVGKPATGNPFGR